LNLEKAILDPANTRSILTNSQLSKKIIAETYPFPPERIHVVYNGVDHDQFSPGDRRDDGRQEIQLLFVGQDFKRKGLAPLLAASPRVRREGVPCRLPVIGRGRPKPYPQRSTQWAGARAVSFEGPTREMQQAYRATDLFVFPTLYDPFANVCLEAMAC